MFLCHLLFIYHFYQHSLSYNPLVLLILFVFHLICAILLWTFFFGFANVCTIVFTSSTTLVYMFFIKMHQNYLALAKIQTHGKKLYRLNRFHVHHIQSLEIFFMTNRLYGKLFFTALLTFYPVNTQMIAWMITGYVTGLNRAFISLFIIHEFYCIFAVHLFLAKCTKVIHRPSVLLLNLMANSRFSKNGNKLSSAQMKLSNLIYAFHSVKRYGFTYGSFGLITMAAFAKYLMQYGKFLMISYKIWKQY